LRLTDSGERREERGERREERGERREERGETNLYANLKKCA
jgi:hypothetical protein